MEDLHVYIIRVDVYDYTVAKSQNIIIFRIFEVVNISSFQHIVEYETDVGRVVQTIN